jgi:dephospho-CoA kinase
MNKIGVTGGINSGKTTVCKVFECLGVPVFYSDTQAKICMQENLTLKKEIISIFGENAYIGGKPNAAYLKGIFEDAQQLKTMNRLVHPKVEEKFQHWCKGKTHPYLLKESAILLEEGLAEKLNGIILVVAPLDNRIEWLKQRQNITIEDFHKRRFRQWTDEEKRKKANWVIENNNQKSLIEQVLAIHNLLKTKTPQE